MSQLNELNEASDKGGLAPHKSHCPHVFNAIDIPSNLTQLPTTCSFFNCNKGECWLCLKCHATFCGRYANQHMIYHYIYTNMSHCMAMGINDLSFWCYKCENYIDHLSVEKVWDFYSIAHSLRFNQPIPAGLLQKTSFKHHASTAVTMEAIVESEEEKSDQFDFEEKKEANDTHSNLTIDIIDDLLSKFTLEATWKWNGYRKTALFYHPDCLLHEAGKGSHVERPERCSTAYKMLCDYGLLRDLIEIRPREASKAELAATHTMNYVDVVLGNEGKRGWYDADTFYNEYSCHAAKLAAGATIDVLKGILQRKYDSGFALVRPPGHHCEQHKAMGFCIFNNAAIAVNCIRDEGLCQKVLIVDWDIHHGNGTQNMFYNDGNVLYFSVHRHDNGLFYPSTGKAAESGKGFNVNVPLNVDSKKGHGDKEYLLIWKHVLLPICKEFGAEIVLISAGFDASIGDPLGAMRITPPCYGLLTRLLLNECDKVGLVLEGGYNLDTMPRAVCCCNYALLTGPKQQKDNYDVNEFYAEFCDNIKDGGGDCQHQAFNQWFEDYGDELLGFDYYASTKKTVKKVLEEQQKYWKCARQILNKYYKDTTETDL